MPVRTETLRSAGGLHRGTYDVLHIHTQSEVARAFARAHTDGTSLTLIGSRRSFGEQFLPPSGALGLDVSALDRGAEVLEHNADGSLWVRAGGGTRFCDLYERFPEHRTANPPTSDRITLSGALAACTHNSGGYFASSVRAFTLLAPSGRFRCERAAGGEMGQLFEGVIGAFGALGVCTEIELLLQPIAPSKEVLVHTLYAGPATGADYLRVLQHAFDNPRFAEGRGAVVYGRSGHAIVLADELAPAGAAGRAPRALLTDDNVAQHAFQQALANRFPRFAEMAVRRAYRRGVVLGAPWYGFQFFQRGYDQAFELLSQPTLRSRLVKALGVDPALPVCHQAWFCTRSALSALLEVYWTTLADYPGIERRVEQQDIVLLGPSVYPLHTAGRTSEPLAVLTSSFAAGPAQSVTPRVAAFFKDFSRRAYEEVPSARVSLCKQMHCDRALLRAMHAPWVERVRALREWLDPHRILTSRFLLELGV